MCSLSIRILVWDKLFYWHLASLVAWACPFVGSALNDPIGGVAGCWLTGGLSRVDDLVGLPYL